MPKVSAPSRISSSKMNNGNDSPAGLWRTRSSCNTTNHIRYEPYMLGNSRGPAARAVTPRAQTGFTITAAASSAPRTCHIPPATTPSVSSYNPPDSTVRDCMFWPTTMGNQNAQLHTGQNAGGPGYYYQGQNPSRAAPGVSGDFHQYCTAPPKIYLSTPGGNEQKLVEKNISCQVAPLGTDPMSLIRPLEPMTVRVQAPADLFTANSSEPRTIAISPAQLYGIGNRPQ